MVKGRKQAFECLHINKYFTLKNNFCTVFYEIRQEYVIICKVKGKALRHEGVRCLPAGSKWPASHPYHFTPGERAPGTHLVGSWVGPRAGLDTMEKRKFLILPELKLQPLGHPAHSQSLY
jgi:hypothetical protein